MGGDCAQPLTVGGTGDWSRTTEYRRDFSGQIEPISVHGEELYIYKGSKMKLQIDTEFIRSTEYRSCTSSDRGQGKRRQTEKQNNRKTGKQEMSQLMPKWVSTLLI